MADTGGMGPRTDRISNELMDFNDPSNVEMTADMFQELADAVSDLNGGLSPFATGFGGDAVPSSTGAAVSSTENSYMRQFYASAAVVAPGTALETGAMYSAPLQGSHVHAALGAPGGYGDADPLSRKRNMSSDCWSMGRERYSTGSIFASDATPTDSSSVWMTLDGLDPDAPAGSRWCYAPIRSTFPLVGLGRSEAEPSFRAAKTGSATVLEYLPIVPASRIAAALPTDSALWELVYAADAGSGVSGFWLSSVPDRIVTYFDKAVEPGAPASVGRCVGAFPASICCFYRVFCCENRRRFPSVPVRSTNSPSGTCAWIVDFAAVPSAFVTLLT
jgi:hypothetical protein